MLSERRLCRRNHGLGEISEGAAEAPSDEDGGQSPPPSYFRESHAPSGIHLARSVVNSSGHTVTIRPPCHCSM